MSVETENRRGAVAWFCLRFEQGDLHTPRWFSEKASRHVHRTGNCNSEHTPHVSRRNASRQWSSPHRSQAASHPGSHSPTPGWDHNRLLPRDRSPTVVLSTKIDFMCHIFHPVPQRLRYGRNTSNLDQAIPVPVPHGLQLFEIHWIIKDVVPRYPMICYEKSSTTGKNCYT